MNYTEFDKKCKCGPEFVCVRIIEKCDQLKVGNVWLPGNAAANGRLAHCIIEDVGSVSAEKYGLEVGDYVMIDRLATFSHTAPVALLKYENVIVKTNADRSEFWPLKNMIFVEPDEKDPISKVGNIYVPGYQDKLNIGTIVKEALEDKEKFPFEVGQKVIVTKGADVVELGMTKIHIYKQDMIICTVED